MKQALLSNAGLRAGLNVYQGRVACEAVAAELDYDYLPPTDAPAV